jgi:hypothetical protein
MLLCVGFLSSLACGWSAEEKRHAEALLHDAEKIDAERSKAEAEAEAAALLEKGRKLQQVPTPKDLPDAGMCVCANGIENSMSKGKLKNFNVCKCN